VSVRWTEPSKREKKEKKLGLESDKLDMKECEKKGVFT